jgi:hypothetical protein
MLECPGGMALGQTIHERGEALVAIQPHHDSLPPDLLASSCSSSADAGPKV